MHVGIIAGTGMASLAETAKWREIETPYGTACLADAVLDGAEAAILLRHGQGLNIPPHLINYRANMWALREAGTERVIATAAVGSMRLELKPGTLAVVSDFIDFTKHQLKTFYDHPCEEMVHPDFSQPYCPGISSAVEQAAVDLGIEMERRVVYVGVDGPRYETPAEVRMFAQWGGDVVGMTGVPEVVLARELGMCYGTMAIITNYAAGVKEGSLSHQEVLACMAESRDRIRSLISRAAVLISAIPICCPDRP